jgi:di/tricarboxylate transporter
MSDIAIVFVILGVVVGLFIWDRLPVILVCVGCGLALWAAGLVSLEQALAGFGDPVTVFVASLFVVGAGLEATGVTAWAGQALMRRAGDSETRLTVLMLAAVALLAGLISMIGAVAALLPVIVALAIRMGRPPSRMLMPLAFGGHAGALLTLAGSPVNVVVLDFSLSSGGGGFGFFEFALVGVPLLAGTILITLTLGPLLLPARQSRNLPPDLSGHARTLVEQFRLDEDAHHLRLRADSPLAGTPRGALALDVADVALVAVKTPTGAAPSASDRLREGDLLVVRGPADAVAALAGRLALSLREDPAAPLGDTMFSRESGLAEIVIPPRSALIGKRVFPGMVTESGDLMVLSIQRAGETMQSGVSLAAGDTVLLQGGWRALDLRLGTADVLVVNAPDLVRRQAVAMGHGSGAMLAILGGMVVLLAGGFAPPAVAGLLAAGAVLLSGILTVDQVYRSIQWTTVILIGGMIPLSTAIIQTGAAQLAAAELLRLVGDGGPQLLLAGLFVLSAVFGQLISNTATALIVLPIAVASAEKMGVSPQPALMCVAVAAAAAFFTPVATPSNLMVMDPGGYRFGDYWKFGLPMMALFFAVAVFLVPMIWPF